MLSNIKCDIRFQYLVSKIWSFSLSILRKYYEELRSYLANFKDDIPNSMQIRLFPIVDTTLKLLQNYHGTKKFKENDKESWKGKGLVFPRLIYLKKVV